MHPSAMSSCDGLIAGYEIRFGIELVDDATRRMELNDWLANKLRPMFEHRVLPITEDILLEWRLLHHGLTVVSRNTRDFERADVAVVNPWS